VTSEPTERPVEVKINAVMAKKTAVARAAISPRNFMGLVQSSFDKSY